MPSKSPADAVPPEAFLAGYSPPLASMAGELRRIVRATLPGVIERVRPGWGLLGYDLPVGRTTVYLAFIWAEEEDQHVHLGFEHGVLMDDPDGALQGEGTTRQVRWLTFRPGDRIDEQLVVRLLREAERHALLPGPVRRAALRDRSAVSRS